MKTFKLVSLQVVKNETMKVIELIDGLIINKENEQNTWLLEVHIDRMYDDYFQELFARGQPIAVQTVITKPENNPAPFDVQICSIGKTSENMNVVMEGKLSKTRDDFATAVLTQLIKDGLSGEALLAAFTEAYRI